jgi:hypothetical protein
MAFAPGPEADAVARIFDESCTMCHDASDDTLNLAADPKGLVGRASTTGVPYVVAGDAEASYLYQKLLGVEGIDGDPMPMGEDPLPPETLAVVRDWIAGLAEASTTDPEATGEAAETPAEPAATRDAPPPIETTPQPGRQPFHGTHQINAQTTTTLGKRTIAYRIHHRFGRFGVPIRDRTGLGLTNGVTMSMAVEYGIIDGLDVLARWSNAHLDWELGLKWIPLRQEEGRPVSFGGFASFEALADFPENVDNPITGNFQLLLSRLWFDRWSTQLLVGYSLFTNHDTRVVADLDDGEGEVEVRDRRGTLVAGLASTIWFGKKKRHGLDLEYQLPLPVADLVFHTNGDRTDEDGTKIGSWALGWSARVGKHFFQVFATNTRNIHTNLAAPGGDTENPFDPFGDFFLGFNISRKWNL